MKSAEDYALHVIARGGPDAVPMFKDLLWKRDGKPPQELQHTGLEGGPIEVIDLGKLSDNELGEVRRLIESAVSPQGN